MANAPQVQTLAQIMADLAPGVQGQQQVIQQQQQGLAAKYGAQKTGLEAEKVRGFNTINNQAVGRGGSFSGVPVDEQSDYLSTKYLPAVAGLEMQQNEEDMGLQKSLADINAGVYQSAFERQGSQQSNLNSWNMQQQSLEAQAREAELDRQATAREAAASRAASAPKELSPQDAALGVINGAVSNGADINSNVFQLARDAYRRAGGNSSNFASEFWKYVPQSANQDNSASGWKSYYYG